MTGIVTVLTICLAMSIFNNVRLKEQYGVAQANVKAYSTQLSEQTSEGLALQLTVSQL